MSSLRPRLTMVAGYLAALGLPPLAATVAGGPFIISPFLVLIALAARFLGFGPAVLCTFASAGSVAWLVSREHRYPVHIEVLRVAIFVVGSLIVAWLSRARSREAREAEERYRNLVEMAPDGILVVDDRGTIVLANTALARIVRAKDAASLIGRNVFDFLPSDERAAAGEEIAQVAAGHRTTTWVRTRVVRVDGTTVDVERAGDPVRFGDRVFAQGFIRDLTERIAREAAVDESQRRLQALFESTIDAIFFFDSEGRYIDVNPAGAAMLGYTRDEITQRRLGDFSTPEDRKRVMSILGGITQGGRVAGEGRIVRKDGTVRETDYRGVGNVLPGLHYLIIHDATERKAAERALRQQAERLLDAQNQERRRVARQLHDTTAQDLAAVRLHLARIRRLSGDGAPAADAVNESIELVDRVITDVRTLSYLLHPPLIDAGLVPAVQAYTAGFQARSGIMVDFDASDAPALPREAETILFRIIQEALTNVQRHSGSPSAHVRIARDPSGVRVEISDRGHGIPAHLRSNEEALFTAGVGMGGMRERVEEMGGTFRVDSSDRGTTVIVTLPIAAV